MNRLGSSSVREPAVVLDVAGLDPLAAEEAAALRARDERHRRDQREDRADHLPMPPGHAQDWHSPGNNAASPPVRAALGSGRPGQRQRCGRHMARTRQLVEGDLLQRADLLPGQPQLES